MRTGMVQILALQVDLRAAELLGPAPGVVDRARTPDVVLEIVFELGDELRVALRGRIRELQFLERGNQRFGDEDAAVAAEMAVDVGILVFKHVSVCKIWASAARTAAMKR